MFHSYKLPITKNAEIDLNTTKKYRIKQLDEIKKDLSATKSILDDEYSNLQFDKFWKECDPFHHEKRIVAWLGNTCNVTNAWLKCYEILVHYNLLPDKLDDSILGNKTTFNHFDNAAFPGSFILSTHHLAQQKSWHRQYRWYGSSLLDKNTQNAAPLDDKFKLYATYPDQWLMSVENNGDVLLAENQIEFCKSLGGKIDLYTSDLGFDVSADYNNQELIHLPANIGQILTGLLTLRKGGSLVTKQYMFFESVTVSIIYLLGQFFEELHICKPITSRQANSEVYLVGKGFLGGVYLSHPYIRELFNKLACVGAKPDSIDRSVDMPIFNHTTYNKEFLPAVVRAAKKIFTAQEEKIKHDVDTCRAAMKIDFKGKHSVNIIIQKYRAANEELIRSWYKKNCIMCIAEEDRLTTVDVFKQL